MRRVLVAAVGCGLTAAAAGCGTAANISCKDFLSAGPAKQTKVAKAWTGGVGTGAPKGSPDDPAFKAAMTKGDVKLLTGYCQKPGHADDKVKDLTL